MDTPRSSEPADFVTFEVTMPEEPQEQVVALYGLASALGWRIRERATLTADLVSAPTPELMKIHPASLSDISSDLFGNEDYGLSAQAIVAENIDVLKRNYSVFTYRRQDGSMRLLSDIRRLSASDNETGDYQWDEVRGRSDEEKIITILEEPWRATNFPFELDTVRARDEIVENNGLRTVIWELVPGSTTRPRLANFLRSNGLDINKLHGAIGKAIDVLNVAAGTKKREDVEPQSFDDNLAFIDYELFREMLRNSGLKRNMRDEIRHAIEWGIHHQMMTGRPVPYRPREIIVEGRVDWVYRGGHRVPTFDRIAQVSLANLLANEPETRHAPAKAFLKQFS